MEKTMQYSTYENRLAKTNRLMDLSAGFLGRRHCIHYCIFFSYPLYNHIMKNFLSVLRLKSYGI